MMAPKYIELLDAGTWYLFWRQMKRNPTEVESVLGHPYLGVYTRWWLNRLYTAVVEAKPKDFKNKFRMMGARNFKADPEIPEQAKVEGGVVPAPGSEVLASDDDAKVAGRVTTAVESPALGPVVFAVIKRKYYAPGTRLRVRAGDSLAQASVAERVPAGELQETR